MSLEDFFVFREEIEIRYSIKEDRFIVLSFTAKVAKKIASTHHTER
jgi:hypothetical protein